MSKTVDERVVSMEFDNKRFESNVQTTLGSLDKLKKSLNLEGAAKGLTQVDDAAKKIDMSTLGNAVETVRTRFSALEVMAVTALANITNSVVNTGKKMVSALTIDPIKTGFNEYETKMGAIQTIMSNTASKGTTMQDVTRVIGELNTYADKTIYNFAEMTKNIGTFTAAGVGLEESASAIQGIANLAAASGSTSQQASTAMYQLSQALAAGTVKLMDWNSVVNAGMGGEKFQEALKATAREHGVSVDSMIKKAGSFRESLKEGWITADVLNETLNKFTVDGAKNYSKSMMESGKWTQEQADALIKEAQAMEDAATKVKTFTQLWDTLKESAQSGWSQSWELIVGDFDEAKDTLTEMSEKIGKIINDSAESRNKLLTGALSTGWKQLLNEGITDVAGFEERVTEVAKKHGVDLSKMINDETTFQDTLKEGWMTTEILGESIDAYGKKLKGMSEKELEAAGYTMKDVEAFEALEKKLSEGKISVEEFTKLMSRPSGRQLLVESLWNAFDALLEVIKPIKQAFNDIFPPATADQLYNLIQGLHAFTEKLKLSETTTENLRRTFAGVFAAFDIGVQLIKALFNGFADLVGYVAPAGDGILSFTARIGDFIVGIDEAIKKGNVFGKIIDGVGKILKPIADGVKVLGKSISDAFESIGTRAKVRFEPLSVLGKGLMAVFVGIGNIIKNIAPGISKFISGVGNGFTTLMDKITSSIQNADYNALFDIISGGVLTAIGINISKFIKSAGDVLDNAGGFLDKFGNILDGVKDALNAFTESIKAKTLKTIATAIGILALSLVAISLIDSAKLTSSLTAISALFAELLVSMAIFGKIADGKSFDGIGKMSRAMMTLSGALLVLSIAMKIMSTMSWKEMGVGLISTVVGIGALVTAVNLLPEKEVTKSAKAIKKMSSALLVFAVAMKIMGSMSWKEMGVGLVGMAAGLAMMVAAVNLLPKDMAVRTAGMVGLATAMVILGAALKIMGSMSWKEMGVGLITLTGALTAITLAMNFMPKNMIFTSVGLLAVSGALVIIASALKIMASMSWEEVARGLVALGGSLAIIAVGMMAMKTALPGAAALLVVSAALAIFTPVLMGLGSMSWGEIVKGLVTLAGALAIIGIAGLVLAPVIPAILGLGAALALFGVGIAAIGAGVLMCGVGLTALAAALAASGGAIVVFVSSIIGLIPYLIEQIGVGIIKLCEVIAGSAAAICEAVTVIIVSVMDALVTSVPAIVDGVLKLIVSLLESLIEYLPQIVPLLITLFTKVIDLIVENMPAILDGVVKFLVALLDGVASRITELVQPLVNLFGAIFQGIADVIGPVVESVIAPLLETVLNCFVKLFEVLEPHIPMICELVGYLVTTVTDAIVRIFEIISPYMPEVTRIVEIIADAVTKIIDDVVRLFEEISPILDSISNIISEAGDAINDALTGVADIIDSVGGVIDSWFDGISGVIDSVGNAALNAGKGFEKLANGVKTITDLKLADMVASLTSVATGLGKIAKHSTGISDTGTGMKKIADALKSSYGSFDKITDSISGLTKGLGTIGPVATKATGELTSATTSMTSSLTLVSSSVNKSTSTITASLTSMGVACAKTINGFRGHLVSAGEYMMGGLASGIRNGKPSVLSAARSIANSVESIIRSAWQVNSPSKLFYKIALGVGEGMEYALEDSTSGVKNSALELADATTKGVGNAISKIADVINNGVDARPTIRPVLDLSNVRSGANAIGSMLSANRSLVLDTGTIGAVSASMSTRQNGNGTSELLSAIKGLRKDFANAPRNTYSINGITYDDGSNVSSAIETLIRAAKMERRV